MNQPVEGEGDLWDLVISYPADGLRVANVKQVACFRNTE